MNVLAMLLLTQVFGSAWAQTPAPTAQVAPGVQRWAQPKPATALILVEPSGQLKKAPNRMNLQLQTEILKEPTSVGEILRRNGLSEDANTLDMLKRLNPGHDFSSRRFPMGTKIDLFTPKPELDADRADLKNLRMTFDTPVVAKWAVRDQVREAASIRATAYKLSAGVFANKSDLALYRQAASDTDDAAKMLFQRADMMAPADLAVAQYQIDYATRRAAIVSEKAAKQSHLASDEIVAVKLAAAPMQPMVARMMSGQSPLPLRRVKVSVLRKESSEDVKGLQVYVLPGGIVDTPGLFRDTEILNYLTRFSFVDETSPTTQNVAVFDARVWVGPKLKFVEMTHLVKQGQLKKFLPIDDPAMLQPTIDLIFRAPDQIVEP